MSYSIEESENRRRELVFPQLEDGFTHMRDGRSGFLYYKRDGRMLELYTEISGVPEYNYLIWEEGLDNWVYPQRQAVWIEEKKRIALELVFWLKRRGDKTDFEG